PKYRTVWAGRMGAQPMSSRTAGSLSWTPTRCRAPRSSPASRATKHRSRPPGEQRLRAICLFHAMHAYKLDDERVREVFAAASQHQAAVFVHCGVLTVGVRKKLGLPSPFDLRLGDPLALSAIAARFPAVPVIVPHFGAGMWREALMAADQCGNIHLDT